MLLKSTQRKLGVQLSVKEFLTVKQRHTHLNALEHTAGCETVETSMSFACNSSFLSVDGMTCLIPFES